MQFRNIRIKHAVFFSNFFMHYLFYALVRKIKGNDKGLIKPIKPNRISNTDTIDYCRKCLYIINQYSTWQCNCKTLSLATSALLSKHAISHHILVGVKKEQGLLKGHAWVEAIYPGENKIVALNYIKGYKRVSDTIV